MSPDSVAVIVRAGAFVALFQAAGIAIFLGVFGDRLAHTGAIVRRLGLIAAAAGMLLIVAHQLLEAARMADDFDGVLDGNLQYRALVSSGGATHAAQVFGLVLVALGIWRLHRLWSVAASAGAAIAILAFLLTGHTSVHAMRWLLAPLLALHLSIVAFWFGALAPLFMVAGHEPPSVAAWVMQKFSAVVGWLVPGILLAGLAMGWLLAPDLSVLRRPYGALLLLKLLGFGLLMGFAALNKWRWVPGLAANLVASRAALRRSIAAEYLLIVIVLAVTAVLTTFYSPEY